MFIVDIRNVIVGEMPRDCVWRRPWPVSRSHGTLQDRYETELFCIQCLGTGTGSRGQPFRCMRIWIQLLRFLKSDPVPDPKHCFNSWNSMSYRYLLSKQEFRAALQPVYR
jgi:hypothetical protein